MSAVKPNLLLDENWDLDVVNGNLVVSSGADAALQALYQRLRFFLGEWFADEDVGIPYWSDILKKNPNLPAVREIFRRAILASPGIASIEALDVRRVSGRAFSLSFKCTMDDGTLLLSDGYQVGAP